MRKIVGATVGTTLNPKRLEEYVKHGKSAYELAVEHGFGGTETEWLASLKGKDGEDGVDGKDGVNGKDGYTPIKGVDYFDGQPGKDGTTGKDGVDGKDGYTPVKGKDYFDGKDGRDGVDGYTPVKGVDYFTEADKAEMVESVISALPKYDGSVINV